MGDLAIVAAGLEILKALKDNGIIRTPEDEVKAQQIVTENAIRLTQAYGEFLAKTTPASADTPRWINGFIAITRPAMVWLVTGSIVAAFFIPGVADKVTSTLDAFGRAGTAGLAFLSIPVLWVTGRTVEKWAAIKTGNGEIPEIVPKRLRVPESVPGGRDRS